MKRLFFGCLVAVSMFFAGYSVSSASHPLITDDAGTLGKGEFQLELNAEYVHDRQDGVTASGTEVAAALTYGLADPVDLVIGVPYQFVSVEGGGGSESENGVSDISIEAKWRIIEHNGLSFAVKPGVTLPTGDDEKGFGAGKTTYSIFLIGTKELAAWEFHLNVGYLMNENKNDERKDIWHASIAATYDVSYDLKLAGDVGIESNPDKESNTAPAFILGGLIYSVSDSVDVDFGLKAGLNRQETDYSALTGVTLKF
jgi:hypothetical protein